MAKDEKLEWTTSLGGPLVAIPAEIAEYWQGGYFEDTSDYDKACEGGEGQVEVAGWVGTGSLPAEDGRLLVLAGEMDTSFVYTEHGGIIVRGSGVKTVGDVHKQLDKIADSAWQPHEHLLPLEDGELYIFDAAVAGDANPGFIEAEHDPVVAEPGPGTYRVDIWGDQLKKGPLVFVRLTRR